MSHVLTSVMLSWRNVLGQMIPKRFHVRFLSQQRTLLKSRQYLVRRGHAQKNLVKWALTAQVVSVLLDVRVWKLVIREEDWVNHKMHEENFDLKLAVAKQWGIAKVREAEDLRDRQRKGGG